MTIPTPLTAPPLARFRRLDSGDVLPGLYAGWCTVYYPHYFGLHLLELLRFSRKSPAWRGVSLMKQAGIRVLWMVVLWGGSVLALAAVGMGFRLLMSLAGFKS